MNRLNRSLLWKAAAVQSASVAVLSIVLAAALGHRFFVDWGWLVGPGAWIACAAFTAATLRLTQRRALGGAALAGVPSVLAVLVGVHWLGAALAVLVFAVWCARRSAPEHRQAESGRSVAPTSATP